MLSRFVTPFFDAGDGISPSVGAKLFFFATGTSTLKDTFNCPDGTTANANPVIADSTGLFPDIFLSGMFKVVLKDRNDVQIWEADPVSSIIDVDTLTKLNPLTLAAAVADDTLEDGDVLNIKDITTTGDLIQSFADVVLESTVTTNGRNIIVSTGDATLAIKLRPLDETYIEFTWNVDPVLGVDAFGQGVTTGTGAFKTVQFAWDSLPSVLKHQQTIQLADGTYNTSSVPGASQPRPAILWGRNKITTFRSTLSGADLTGAVVIKGNSADNTLVKITTGSEWTSGVYINKGNIAIQDLTVQSDNVTNAEALMVSHRTDTFIHVKNCILDGIAVGKAKIGASCESGGQIEYIDGKIKNSATGVLVNTAGDNFTLSTRLAPIIEGCTTGAIVKNNSLMSINSLQNGVGKIKIIQTCTTALTVIEGAQVTITGQDNGTDMPQIENPVTVEGGHIRCTFAEFLDTVTVENGSLQLRQSNYQEQITLSNSDLWLKTSDSFVDANTENDAAVPIFFTTSSVGRIFDDGTNNIKGLGGQVFSLFEDTLTYAGAGTTEVIHTIANTYEIVSTGGVKTGSQIDSTNVVDGTPIYIFGGEGTATLGVTFTNGTHMEIPTDFTIGGATGHFVGASLTMASGKWRITALGQIRP